MYDGVGRTLPKLANCCGKRSTFCEGRIDHPRAESAKILDRRDIRMCENRRFQEKLPAMLGRFLKEVTLATNVTFQRSHQVFAQIVERRI